MSQFQNETQNFIEDLKSGSNNILVAIRVRPLSLRERSVSEFETIRVLDSKVIVLLDPGQEFAPDDVLRKNRSKETKFAFDYVFDSLTDQQTVYDQSTEFMIDGLLEGYNTTIFSYGATGSGKTFTMIGTQNDQGIMPRAMNSLFKKVLQEAKLRDIQIKLSYMEIYNESIKDLLTVEDKNLDIREDKNAGIQVAGVTEVDVKSVQEVLALLKVGNKNRSKEATEANKESSRSHAILQLVIESREKNQGVQEQMVQSKFSLVDLAGSERASNTNNKGQRMVEGGKINQSLLVLGNCIQALSEAAEKNNKNPFIPYRNSKLTRLLKDSLGGNCRTVMVTNVSPSVVSFEESYNTLIYANRAKNIKTSANRNVLNAQNHISNYAQIIQNLRQENEELKQLIQNQTKVQQLPPIKQSGNGSQRNTQQQQQQQPMDIEQNIHQTFMEINELKRKVYEIEDQIDNYQQNMVFLQGQKTRAIDSLDQIRLQERIDNAKQQKLIVQRSLDDQKEQLEAVLNRKTQMQQGILEHEDNNYKNYLNSLIKQGDLQIENMDIRQQDKRNRKQTQIQEQQIQQLKKITAQESPNRVVTSNINSNSSREICQLFQESIPLIQGIPVSRRTIKQDNIRYSISFSSKILFPKIPLKKKPKASSCYLIECQQILQFPILTMQKSENYYPQARNNHRIASRGQRTPSYQPPSSSKSTKQRPINKSLDYGLNNSLDNKRSYSVKKLQKIHDDYTAQRFQRAFSGKKNKNPNLNNSVPYLNSNKMVLPGMVHESPYVKNFQKDNEPIELKKERLKMLNLNLKGDNGKKFQMKK